MTDQENMDREENLNLEDIIREFSDDPREPAEYGEESAGEPDSPEEEPAEEPAEDFSPEEMGELPEEPAEDLTKTREIPDLSKGGGFSDTIRMDALPGQMKNDGDVKQYQPKGEGKDPLSEGWEPVYDQPIGNYEPPQPIVFRPRARLRELKQKLIEGPEKQYYAMVDRGLGKIQAAIFISVLIALFCGGATALYAMGMVQVERMRLMVFGQIFAMLFSALLASYQMLDGLAALAKKRFTKDTFLVFAFLFCLVDSVFCLAELRVPCCAAFCVDVTMSLWSSYQRRVTQMGQLDSMRKAGRLDSVGLREDYWNETAGLLRGEGRVEDFMDTYQDTPKPEKTLDTYALAAMCAAVAVGITAGVIRGLGGGVTAGISGGFQVLAASALAALPATAFIAVSRPLAVLEKKLHHLGTVLCGWQGVEGLSGKRVFPLKHSDLFPNGTIKMNGVKFYGDREPEEIIAYCAALMTASGGSLAPMFEQLSDSRNGGHYDATELCFYPQGGIGGTVEGEDVLIGSLRMLREQGVELPEGLQVNQAVCVAIRGELCGLFALTYDRTVSAAAGLSTLCSYRKLTPLVVCGDFMVNERFLGSKFGVRTRRMRVAEPEIQGDLSRETLPEDEPALLLVTKEGLAPMAYGVTGARAVRSAAKAGVVIHMLGGICGLLIMLVLSVLGALELVTPLNMLLYQLVWMIPGFLITEWTRSI